MYRGNVCRLCVDICEDYKSLYDESDNANEVHQLMIQYFDQKLFTGNNFNVMCMKCWHQISDFNNFQQSVYRAQKLLQIKEEEIDIKSEEEFLPEENIASSYNEESNDCNKFTGELFRSSSAESLKSDDNMEDDDPVGDVSSGEFGIGAKSNELPKSAAEIQKALRKKEVSLYDKLRRRRKYMAKEKANDDIIAQWTPVLKCLYCNETCTKYSQLQNHFDVKHPELHCQTRCCERYFSRCDRFVTHVRLHIDANAFACTVCGAQLDSRRALDHHTVKHHPATVTRRGDSTIVTVPSRKKTDSEPTTSGDCNLENMKTRRKRVYLKSDTLLAKWLPATQCGVCKKACTPFTQLQSHFLECHPDEDLYVECCNRKLRHRRDIGTHVRFHINPTAYKCDLCCICYKYSQTLKNHMRDAHQE